MLDNGDAALGVPRPVSYHGILAASGQIDSDEAAMTTVMRPGRRIPDSWLEDCEAMYGRGSDDRRATRSRDEENPGVALRPFHARIAKCGM